MSLPHIQFYPGDWRKDMAIQSLSYHHRGVWFELLLLMHCSEERGKLVLNGRPMTNSGLARLLGMTEGEAKDAIDILIASGVASREATGAIVNRRMVREEELRQKRRDAGKVGGSKTQAKREANPYQVTDNDNDSSSVSVSFGKSENLFFQQAKARVLEFAKSEGIRESDADWFFHKCEGSGWTNGGQPIRDWKATLRSWKRAGYLPSQKVVEPGRNSQRSMSAFEIEKRIAAITEEISKTWKRNGGKRVPADGIDELKKRRDELHHQLVA